MLKLLRNPRSAPFVAEYPSFEVMSVSQECGEIEERIAGERGTLCLYLHLPFCRYRCHFCYYKVAAGPSIEFRQRYIRALFSEIAHYGRLLPKGTVDVATVYWGGGTPTYLSEPELESIWEAISTHFNVDNLREFTCEVEPGAASLEKFRALRQMGVNRLSIGAQHFNDIILQANGRPHRAAAVRRSVELARTCGFENINLDLLSGLLGDSPALWPDVISELLTLRPEHVSVYRVQILPNTVFAETGSLPFEHAVLEPVVETEIASFAYWALEENGYLPHTSFSFVREPRFSHLHRELAWATTPMLGLGVSAFSTLPGLLFQNSRSFEGYLSRMEEGQLAIKHVCFLDPFERKMRTLFLGIKMGKIRYADLDSDLHRTFEPNFETLVDERLAIKNHLGIELTRHGRLLADDIIAWLLQRAIQREISGANNTGVKVLGTPRHVRA